ncbi:MAG: hypothetical protein WC649_11810 [Desulfobacteria bacterium]
MNRCFVMQPFDGGAFDKRYDDVFVPAIKEAGLEPYRVDRDPGVSIPIDDIESGIINSSLCLADITTDNPNVWFELGFAIAVPKEVVLVCADARTTKFPFDVQHRNIIKYKTESPQDFVQLKEKITTRINAILNKLKEITNISNISPVVDTEGLSQHELVALVTVMQNSFISEEGVTSYKIKEDMNNAGFTDIAISLALVSLSQKSMIKTDIVTDYNGNPYRVYNVISGGSDWLGRHQDLLVLKEQPMTNKVDDSVPF